MSRKAFAARLERATPPLLNVASLKTLFWDGREHDLVSQARSPLINPREHGLTGDAEVVAIVKADAVYRREFERVLGGSSADLRIEHVSRALASYTRAVSFPAPPPQTIFCTVGKTQQYLQPRVED